MPGYRPDDVTLKIVVNYCQCDTDTTEHSKCVLCLLTHTAACIDIGGYQIEKLLGMFDNIGWLMLA